MKSLGNRQNAYFLKFQAKKNAGKTKKVNSLISYELKKFNGGRKKEPAPGRGEIEYRGFRLFEAVHNGNERFVVAEPLDVNGVITKIRETVITAETFAEARKKIDENFVRD